MAVGKQYEYDAVIRELPEKGGAYVVFPWNIREEFGKGRVKVHATFDGVPYDGSIVRMGTPGHILGLRKDIRTQIENSPATPWPSRCGNGNSGIQQPAAAAAAVFFCPRLLRLRRKTGG